MKSCGTHPNPLIQSLQLAGVNWVWPNESLSAFWKTTTKVMGLAGWSGFSNPWAWHTVCTAHLWRLGVDLAKDEVLAPGVRMEACIAVWLHDNVELYEHPQAEQALLQVYLPHVNTEHLDVLAAIFWVCLFSFEMEHAKHSLTQELAAWRLVQPNATAWLHAYQVVHPFGMELLPTARHMLRIVQGLPHEECASLDGLLAQTE